MIRPQGPAHEGLATLTPGRPAPAPGRRDPAAGIAKCVSSIPRLALRMAHSGRRPVRPGVQKLILLILADVDGAGMTIDELAMLAGVHAHTVCSALDVLMTIGLVHRRDVGAGDRCLTPRRSAGPLYAYCIDWAAVERLPKVELRSAAAYRRRGCATGSQGEVAEGELAAR